MASGGEVIGIKNEGNGRGELHEIMCKDNSLQLASDCDLP